MKRVKIIFKTVILAVGLTFAVRANAQTVDEFRQFRQSLMNDFQGFRNKVLDDYADYLEGVWEEFSAFKAVERDATPKPVVAPKVPDKPVVTEPVSLPSPDIVPAPKPIDTPVLVVPEPATAPKPDVPTPRPIAVPQPAPTPQPALTPQPVPTVPTAPITPTPPIMPAVPAGASVGISFAGTTLNLPKIDVAHIKGTDSKSVADGWRKYKTGNALDAVPVLKSLADCYGMNDWLQFLMVRQYANVLAKDCSVDDRILLQQFLLANMGFDIRLARTDVQLILLVPFDQMVYARSYLQFNGVNYYIYYDELEGTRNAQAKIYTCSLPEDADCGKRFDLMFNRDVTFPEGRTVERTLTDGAITVTESVNADLMELLRHYPQMGVPAYATSDLSSDFRNDILAQISRQISGLSQKEAAGKLIHFVQYAFEYATDGNQHGYEKPYFIEENFYYPKNDCEDRAVFFAFLVHNLLNLDVHLVQFPGHECTAVRFNDALVVGDNYTHNGHKYTICDPTYIGADIGMCMPMYKNEKLIVETWY